MVVSCYFDCKWASTGMLTSSFDESFVAKHTEATIDLLPHGE